LNTPLAAATGPPWVSVELARVKREDIMVVFGE